ncbi:MAG: AAA family ATPase [Nanoarchaeota archaeon]
MGLLIAISGKQGSGKTTAANYLVENFNFKIISFSDKIKEVAMDLFGASYEESYGKSKNRLLLQKIGYHMREINYNVWTN